jgi:5-methyltetrahydropteroyltriglutamate--homocysteine methyltransferase
MTTIKEELHVSARTTPPFRADHVGSLLRPPELRTAREDHASGRIDADELRAVEDRAIADAVKMQEEIGLLTVTDGEFRRASWHMDFIYQLGGIHPSEHTIFGDDFATLKGLATTAVPKQTIPSPSMVHYRGGRAVVDEDVYPDMEAFWADVAAAYAEEIRRLGELGCTYLQLDDTCFAYLNDPEQRRQLQARGDDAEHLHLEYIRHFNDAVRDRPEGMTIATHTCRGNFRSSWVAEGGYDFVAEPFFNELDTDAFFMEWDDERSGTFDALRFVPKGKFVVLGLVTSKRPAMETKDELKRRVEEAARFVPLDQLCLSPQCGFSSTVDGNALTFEQQREKLRLVVETAAEIWG